MSDLEALFESLRDVQEFKPAPCHLWTPSHVGDIDITIDEHGAWWHEGGLIARQQLVRLFSTILCVEEGRYYLLTPAEKLFINVADVPFVVNEAVDNKGELVLKTNIGEAFTLTEMEMRVGIPYVHVRDGLWAKVARAIYYSWVEASHRDGDDLYISSGGHRFLLGSVAE